MTQATAPSVRTMAMPREVERLLRRVDRRLRGVSSLKGLGTVCLVVAVGAALGMLLDFLLRPMGLARWIAWTAWVATSVLFLLAAVLRPLLRKNQPLALAALVERAEPGIGERLTTTVALLRDFAHLHGSRELALAHTDETAALAASIGGSKAVPGGQGFRRFLLGVVVTSLVALPVVAKPDPFRSLLTRFAAPWLPLDPISRFAFRVTPGDKTVAIGSDLQVSAWLDSRFNLGGELPSAASIEWTDAATRTTRRLPMLSKPTGTGAGRLFEVVVPKLESSLDYRIVAESERSRAFAISAVEPPKVAALGLTIDSPEYTKQPRVEIKDPTRLTVIEGSTLTFAITPSKAVSSVSLGWPDGKAERTIEATFSPDRATASASVLADLAGSFPYTITLGGDAAGIIAPPETRRVIVKADAPPSLVVQELEGPNEAGPDDTLGIGINTRDDFGIGSIEFHYQISRKDASEGQAAETGKTEARLPGVGTPRAKGEISLPLKPLKVQPGDLVRYMVRVADNRPAPRGPNVVWSEPCQLTIVEKAEPILARRDRVHRESVKERLDKIKAEAVENRREAEQLRYAADAAKREAKGWDKEHEEALAAREVAAGQVRDELRELARDLENDPSFSELARPAQQVANVEAEAGRERLEHAKKAPGAAERLEDLRQADARLGSVQIRLEELSRRFDALAKVDADRQTLRDLAAKEDAIADQLAGAKPEELDHLLAEQLEAKKDLDALLSRSPELRAGVLAKQAEQAAQLAEKAKALAERQREEARKTTDLAQPNDKLKALADEQRKIEEEARRLALDIDEPLGENGRGRLNVEPIRAAAEPIERGDIGNGRQRLEEAERELRRLTHDLADVLDDPKALARRLMQRQNLVAQRVAEAVREAKGKATLTPAEKTDLAARLKPLAESQKAIAKLAEALKPEDPNHANLAREAARLTAQAADPLTNLLPKEAEPRQSEARNALNRLADALPDQWRRQEPARQKLDLARRVSDEVQRDLTRHLNETAPKPWQPEDPVKRASDLAQRIKPLSGKLAEATKALGEMKPDRPADPQRQRAEHRMKQLAEAIEAIRKEAEAAGQPQAAKAVPNWQVAGPFPMNAPPPFDVAGAVDFNKSLKLKDPKAKVPTWKPVADGARMNLGQLFGEEKEKSAFAVAEINSPVRRMAELRLGSDDTLTVWVNGKEVHNFQGNRAFSPDGVKINVELQPGVNRVVARIGNRSDRWEFGAAITPAPPAEFQPERLEARREAMPQRQAETKAALERLTQKMAGQTPADDLAEELAAEQQAAKSSAEPVARALAVREQQRLSTALRGLAVPDAPLLQAEAVRLADRAADMLANAQADPAPAMKDAADAAKALADRLTDRISPRNEAEALARAERGLLEPDAPKSPMIQAERQKAIADRTALLTNVTPQAIEATRQAARATERDARMTPAPPQGEDPLPDPKLAREAAMKALDALAQSAPDASAFTPQAPAPITFPVDPELHLTRERVDQARQLAQRQRRVREHLQAIVGDRVEPQEALRDEAAELGRDFAELREQSRETSPRSQGQAQQAADLLSNHAPKIMEQGTAQLAEGRPREAKETQRRAAETLERAAQAAEDLAANLNTDRDARPSKQQTEPPTSLGDARESMSDAAKALSQARQAKADQKGQALANAQSQAPGARKAADALRAAAQQSGRPGPGEEVAQGEPGGNDPTSRPIQAGTADLSALQAAVEKKTGRKWGELPGHLRSEILQRAQGKYRDDYSRLIQLYFQEIASEGGKPGGE